MVEKGRSARGIMGIGFGELVIIVGVMLALVRPQDVSEFAEKLAGFTVRAKKEGERFVRELQEPVDSVVKPINEVKDEINGIVNDLSDLNGGGNDGNRTT